MAGGPALYRGANLQALFAAWCAVLALAEDTSQLIDITRQRVERVGMEQGWPLDDNAIWCEGDVRIFAQVKESLNVSSRVMSDYASVWTQIVEQYLHGRGRESGSEPLLTCDRFMIVVGENTSSRISRGLYSLLSRMENHPPGDALATVTHGETKLQTELAIAINHIRRLLGERQKPSTDDDVRKILSHCKVFNVTQTHLRASGLQFMNTIVLADGQSATSAMAVLERLFADAGEVRNSYSKVQLRQHLHSNGLKFRGPRSLQADIEKLATTTAEFITRQTSAIPVPEGEVIVKRQIADAIVRVGQVQNIAVTSRGGGGKSVVLAQVANSLRESADCVVIAIDANLLDSATIHASLCLDHRLEEILARWPDDGRHGCLIIDSFDALRLGSNMDRLIAMIEKLRVDAPKWRVIVASREYDLSTFPNTARAFPNTNQSLIHEDFRDNLRFGSLSHAIVHEFSDEEIETVKAASPSMRAFFEGADCALKQLLRNPFNLARAAEIIARGGDLSLVTDRIGLLDLWWNVRICVRGRFEREAALRCVVAGMVGHRRLRLAVSDLDPIPAVLESLLSDSILVTSGPRSNDLVFPHTLLFDYTAYRVYLESIVDMVDLLRDEPDSFVFLLTSIHFRLDTLWNEQRLDFYSLISSLFAEAELRRLALLVLVARVLIEKVETIADLEPIFATSDFPRARVVRFIVRALIRSAELGDAYMKRSGTMWAAFAQRLTIEDKTLQHDASLLLIKLIEHDAALIKHETVAQAARNLLSHVLGES